MAAPEPLSGRYRFVRSLRAHGSTVIWLATDELTERPVVASLLPAQRAALLSPLVGLSHAHVAHVVEVREEFRPDEVPEEARGTDGSIVIAHYVAGRTLARRLDAGPLEFARAVKWAERLSDGLAAIHGRGAAHGAISPRSIVAARVDRARVPLLSLLVAPPSGPFCSPERVLGAGPSPEDDVWALAATLYTMLACKAPFAGESRKHLAAAILRARPPAVEGLDPTLAEALHRALHNEPKARLKSASELGSILRAWLSEREESDGALPDSIPPPDADAPEPPEGPEGYGESVVLSAADVGIVLGTTESTSAPPEPAPAPPPATPPEPALSAPLEPPPATRAPEVPTSRAGAAPRRSRALPAVLGLAVIGVLVVSLLWRRQPAPSPPTQAAGSAASLLAEPPKRTPLAPSASAASRGETTPPPAALVEAGAVREGATACLQGFLPEGAFGEEPDLDFVCEEADLWLTSRKVLRQIANRGTGPGVTLWAYLSRYELAAIARMRNACCPSAAPFEVATPKTACGTLTEPLVAVGEDPSAENILRYETTIDCLIRRKVRYPEPWDRVGVRDAREHFDQFVELSRPAARLP